MQVCRTDRLFHYLLQGDASLPAILTRGLLPLSAMPESDRWRSLERESPGFFAELYRLIAEPIIKRPYSNSGVFLTPIDFRLLPEYRLARLTRISIPLEVMAADRAILTYELDGERRALLLSADTLEETAQLWPDTMVRRWFGRNPSMMFYRVPQVAAYADEGIPVPPEWVERP